MVCLLATAIAQKSGNCHLITWDDENGVPFYDIGSNVVYTPLGKTGGFYGKLKKYGDLSVTYEATVSQLGRFVMSGDKHIWLLKSRA